MLHLVTQHSLLFRWLSLFSLVLVMSGCGQKGPLTTNTKGTEIRFYALNSDAQQSQIILVPNTSRTGCNDLPIPRAVYRVAQVGFAFCEVYKKRGCELGSEHTLMWSGSWQDGKKPQPAARITPGAEWLFADNSTEKVSSWQCHDDS